MLLVRILTGGGVLVFIGEGISGMNGLCEGDGTSRNRGLTRLALETFRRSSISRSSWAVMVAVLSLGVE
jgi:hypothetical protein